MSSPATKMGAYAVGFWSGACFGALVTISGLIAHELQVVKGLR